MIGFAHVCEGEIISARTEEAHIEIDRLINTIFRTVIFAFPILRCHIRTPLSPIAVARHGFMKEATTHGFLSPSIGVSNFIVDVDQA